MTRLKHSHMSQLLGNNQAVLADEGSAGGADASLAVGCQRYVRRPRVPAVERPLGLAMPDDKDSGRRHCVTTFCCLWRLSVWPASIIYQRSGLCGERREGGYVSKHTL